MILASNNDSNAPAPAIAAIRSLTTYCQGRFLVKSKMSDRASTVRGRSLRKFWPRGFKIPKLAALLACGMVVVMLAEAAATTSQAPAADRYTPLVQSVLSTPHWFVGVDGRVHLVYELELITGFPVPVTLDAVTVRDRVRGR
ncbi:MAG: hypothetical protein ACRDNS_10140, partial [Trebonia sp.]